MAYGERKGVRKEPGDFSFVDMFGLGVASAFGIVVATFFDLTQSDEASALFVFNKWLGSATSVLGLADVPLFGVVLILMAIGGLSILFFQPVTMRGAFLQGFGALAAMMTVVPAELGTPAPGVAEGGEMMDLPEGADPWGDEAVLEEISFRDGSATAPRSVAAASSSTISMLAAQSQGYSCRIKIVFPDGLKEPVNDMIRKGSLRGRLHNSTSNATYNLFRNTGANMSTRGNTIYLATLIPGDTPSATLLTRIEADGYRIENSEFQASQGVNPVWTIRMTKSSTPLVLQQLRQPYTW